MPVTMQDIADRAGVSRPVVCGVLGGKTTCGCSEKKRREILDLVRELGYEPNLQARRLRQGCTKTVGILFRSFRDRVIGELMTELYRELLHRGYTSIISFWETTEEIESAYRIALSNRVDGIITSDYRKDLLPAGLPAVVYGKSPRNVDSVEIDYGPAFAEAVGHLAGLGHRRFGFIGPESIRKAAFQAACEAAGVETFFHVAPGFPEFGRAGIAEFSQIASPPTAVFCQNDSVALAACGEASRRGMKIGADISVVGLDNTLESELVFPELTTIDTLVRDKASLMAEMLLQRITHPRSPTNKTRLEAKLIIRGSAGRAPRPRQ